MNPVVIIHLFAAAVAIAVSLPLMKGRVKMNHWYGVRIPAAFISDEAWFDINRYGGRLLFMWGLLIAATAIIGAFLGKKNWVAYNWVALVVIIGSLVLIAIKVVRYAQNKNRRTRRQSQRPQPPRFR